MKRGGRQMGGTTKPVSLKLLVPFFAGASLIVITLASSFNGSAWNLGWLSPVIWDFRVPRVLTAFIVGTISVIGLVAPHITGRLVGFRHLPLMLSSGLIGGLLLVTADFIGRTHCAK